MSKHLDLINKPQDIKTLKIEELYELAEEIRALIINTVSENGGHLASNLGVVELTLALNMVYDFSKDRIVWDVGHQSYTHKILSERKNIFHTLRKEGGVSGFPKTSESCYDAFNTGHSSTSVSAALGMARARDLKDKDYKVCAVIGDGALTGGMAFEGLNDMGQDKGQLLVVLNDNEMSINKNVGGLSKYLNKIASKPGYHNFKKGLRKKLIKIPKIGEKVINYLSRIKTAIKYLTKQNVLFDDLGVKYIGPVNGHNIKEMVQAMERANKIGGPVVLHVKTVKGLGYDHAEKRPQDFHGVAPFHVPSGGLKSQSNGTSNSLCFSESLCLIAAKNRNVVAITAAMPNGTRLDVFANQYPDRFYDVGIAEQHAVTLAAGMAMAGLVPCVALYSTFLQRAYDQILHDVALQNLHVVFGIDRAGVVGEDGETHQGIYDISFLNTIPNFTIFAPSSLTQLEEMLDYAVNKVEGPVAVRYPRKTLPQGESKKSKEHKVSEFIPKADIIKEGTDVTIVAVGDMLANCMQAAELLQQKSCNAEVIDLKVVKPLDIETLTTSAIKTKKVIVIENNIEDGGAGQMILCELAKAGIDCKVKILALPNEIIHHASVEQVFQKYALDCEGIAQVALSI